MRSCRQIIALSLVMLMSLSGHALEPMTDDLLSEVAGQEGVQLTLRLRNNVDVNNQPIGCSGPLNPCRLGIEFAGREGVWLMLKDYYGYLEINDVRLEGDVLPAGATAYANPSRFLSLGGTCLVAGCTPAGLRAVRVFYPLNKAPGQYNDFNLFVNIGRTALEFDNTATIPATPGYMRDAASGSVLGYRMADSTGLNAPSRSRFDGNAYVFGF